METKRERYSSCVRLSLEGAGQTVRLSQVAPDWVIPSQPMDLPSCDVAVIVWVDGDTDVRRMHLPNGKSASGDKVRIVTIA